MGGKLDPLQSFLGLGIRPLVNGERRSNPDGSYSTELLMSSRLPDGTIANFPSLWNKDGEFKELDEDSARRTAMMLERMTGVRLPRYGTMDAATDMAKQASAAGGGSIGDYIMQRLQEKMKK